MRVRFRMLSVISLLLSGELIAGAQVLCHADTLKTTVFFQRNSASYDPDYRDNGIRLRSFISSVLSVIDDEGKAAVSISGTAGASVNGIVFDERSLCDRRISELISGLSGPLHIARSQFGFRNEGQNWRRLEKCVAETPGLHCREEVLSIIRDVPEKKFIDDTLADTRIFRLMNLDRGKVWPELEKLFSREMDVAEIWCIHQTPVPVTVSGSESASAALEAQVPQLSPDSGSSAAYRRFMDETAYWMAVRTNLLYDLALVPNVGIEFSVGKRFSVSATWEYAYWTSGSDLIHKVYGGDMSVRWWFGRGPGNSPLTGHHVGPYGQMAAFDFAYGRNRFASTPWRWAAGLEYGYTLPFVNGRMAFDFTIGVGYSSGIYDFWTVQSNASGNTYYEWNHQSEYQYIGPTKAEISLIWLIGIGRR